MTSFSAPLRSLTLIALAAGMAHAAVDITSVSPNHGVITGGTVVVITGTGLAGLDTAAEIIFGGTAVASVISFSATQVVVTTPVMTQGSIAVAGSDGGPIDSLAGFIAYESDVAALQINISVTINQILYLAWTASTVVANVAVTEGDTSAVTWALGTMTVAQIKETASDAAYDFQVRNTGNGPIDVTVHESSSAAYWTRSADLVAGVDEYVLGVSTTGGAPWTVIGADNTQASAEISAALAAFGTRSFDLYFQAPTSVTSFGAKAMALLVTATTPD